jgi:cation diffusion facilitator CzcD-associated flavoprotein CzcO
MPGPDAIIIGAGPAGLAAAHELNARGLETVILEKEGCVGAVWRRHYDRLHLHTPRSTSSLPGLKMPTAFGRYPSRSQFVEYLESYATKFALKPRFGAAVKAVRRDGGGWLAEAGAHSTTAAIIVVATGWADFPYLPTWPGMDSFKGPILHSSAYRNPNSFAGKRTLVVGFGNSGAEIALDLCEAAVEVALSVRSPVCVLPRDFLGIPVVNLAIAQRFLPAGLVDALNAPLLRLVVGSMKGLGMKQADKGPVRMIKEDGRVPVLDVGTVAKIRDGKIKVRPAIEVFAMDGVRFADGRKEGFDSVILATGFRPDLRTLLPDARGVLDASGKPLVSDRHTAEPGLYFIGAIAVPTGQFREIGIGAVKIANDARRHLRMQGLPRAHSTEVTGPRDATPSAREPSHR